MKTIIKSISINDNVVTVVTKSNVVKTYELPNQHFAKYYVRHLQRHFTN